VKFTDPLTATDDGTRVPLTDDGTRMPTYVRAQLADQVRQRVILENQGDPNAASLPDLEPEDLEEWQPDEEDCGAPHDDHDYDEIEVPDQLNSTVDSSCIYKNISNSSYGAYEHMIRKWSYDSKRASMSGMCASSDEEKQRIASGQTVRQSDYDAKMEELQTLVAGFKDGQKGAYRKIIAKLTAEDDQLRMFMTGGGGVGKSHVIKAARRYAKLHFGKSNSSHGTVVVVAPTGNAAFNAGGNTWQSVLGKTTGAQLTPTNRKLTAAAKNSLKGKLSGLRFLIFDENSMLDLNGLYELHVRLCIAKGTDPANLDIPFGGIHVLFVGDFFQLPPVAGYPLYQDPSKLPLTGAAREGIKLWRTMNDYTELTENVRHGALGTCPKRNPFAAFCRWSRLGVCCNELLDILNKRIGLDEEDIAKKAHPKALWLAPTNELVNMRNAKCYDKLKKTGAFHMRIFAEHLPKNINVPLPTISILDSLFKHVTTNKSGAHTNSRLHRAVVDFAIGSRVACTMNIATELGLYQGAMGTVVGFGFQGKGPPDVREPSQSQHLINGVNEREIPIVFVQMDVLGDSDKEDTMKLTCMPGVPRVVPFVKVMSMHCLQFKYYRYQVPLCAAHSRTFHKAQGLTALDGVTPSAFISHWRVHLNSHEEGTPLPRPNLSSERYESVRFSLF